MAPLEASIFSAVFLLGKPLLIRSTLKSGDKSGKQQFLARSKTRSVDVTIYGSDCGEVALLRGFFLLIARCSRLICGH